MDTYNLIIWTGWIGGGFLALNFLTCLAMPWSKTKCLWKGSRPGPDKYDWKGFQPLAYMHRGFVWISMLGIVIHIILALSY